MKTLELYQRSVLRELEVAAIIHDGRLSAGAFIEAQENLSDGEPAVVRTRDHGTAIVIGNDLGPLMVFRDLNQKIILTGPESTMINLGYRTKTEDITDHWQKVLGPSPSCRANILAY